MEYRACVEELLFSSQVQHMKSIRHHPGVSCYEHSVFVSYVAWYLADRWGADARTAARAGLLHDLYLYDPRTCPPTGSALPIRWPPRRMRQRRGNRAGYEEWAADPIPKHLPGKHRWLPGTYNLPCRYSRHRP